MTPTVLPRAERKVWREMLAFPNTTHIAVAAAMLFFSAIAIPLSIDPMVALSFLLCCLLFYYSLTRSILSLAIYALPAFLLWSFSSLFEGMPNHFIIPTAFFALMAGGACGAFLFLHCHSLKKHAFVYLLPLLAFGAVLLVSRDPILALLTLLPFALAALLALCLAFCLPHTDSVIAATALLTLLLSVVGIVAMARFGLLEGNLLSAFADLLSNTLSSALAQMRELYAQAGMELVLSDIDIANTVAMFINLSPALLVILCTVTAFLTWRTLLGLLIAWRTLPRPPRRLAALSLSAASAALFLLSYLIAMIANSEQATPVGVVAQNLSLVLEPAMALVGFGSLFSKKEASRSCLSYLLIFGILFLLWTNPGAALALVSFFGAIQILLHRFSPITNKKGD